MVYPSVFINGKVVPKEKALIPIWDLGLLRGLGVFDFFRVVDGIPVFVEDHIDRLTSSIRIMGLDNGIVKAQWHAWVKKMIEVNHAQDTGFRIVVTGGYSEDGYSIPDRKNIYMMIHSPGSTPEQQYTQGVSLLMKNYQRDMPLAKTTIYVQSMQQQPEIRKAGAFETLYHWNNTITECSRCNIFLIDHKGELHTPAHEILKGITRKQIIAIAEQENIPLQIRDIQVNELQDMAGAFLTASTKGVLPVVKIGATTIGNGSVHPLSTKLQVLFQKRVAAYIKSHQG